MIFNHGGWIQYFNHTATFRQKSDWPLTYQHAPSLALIESRSYWLDFEIKEQLQKDELLADIAYVQSNCDNPMERDDFVQELMKHVAVDSYGTCLHNKDLPNDIRSPEKLGDSEFLRLLSKYKFVLSIENAACPDYVTEKLWTPLVVGSIPIYLGATNVHEFLPTHKSAILIQDFRSMSDLVDYIRTISTHKQLYYSHLAHKTKSVTNGKLVHALQKPVGNLVEEFECLVCRRVHQRMSIANMGFKPEIFKANANHYGCLYPKTALEILNHETNDGSRRSFWQDKYFQSEIEARVLAQYMDRNSNFSLSEYQEVVLRLLKDDKP
ncbi:hypothetical protein TCAL_04213 [Tigriopus californicus]|uniref:Fucosyltransferase n=2 Tax=Tigriopus californicus TaxID=6832 RepID=A0A553N9B5_TIGCA|nr:hypothetical protein TCAL_04213 [Tigriopus californicus]|eukprot:TCALIF_04213-PA protein Name:"Similar to fut10 Alpha-(1,3)-fucosyltransferase 10 (Xenopus laevis)" AED:0.15 eAED:0.15 QI:0/-1/0/1/-1/1/1/0/323